MNYECNIFKKKLLHFDSSSGFTFLITFYEAFKLISKWIHFARGICLINYIVL
jgi:hypothetical protein